MTPNIIFTIYLFSIVLILFNQMTFFSFKPTPIKSAAKATLESKNLIWKS